MLMVNMSQRERLINKRKITEGLKDAVVARYNNGCSIADIVRACKISRSSVYKIIKERTPVEEDI